MMPVWAWWALISIGLFAVGWLYGRLSRPPHPAGHGPWDTSWAVYFSPNGGRKGGLMKDFRHAWKTACQALGVAGKLFHDFRRAAVRDVVRAGIPERAAQQIPGHKTRSVFDPYHIVSDTDLREAAKRRASYGAREKVTKTVIVSSIERFLKGITNKVKYRNY
jgi:integrase